MRGDQPQIPLFVPSYEGLVPRGCVGIGGLLAESCLSGETVWYNALHCIAMEGGCQMELSQTDKYEGLVPCGTKLEYLLCMWLATIKKCGLEVILIWN